MIKKAISFPTVGIFIALILSFVGELYRFHGFLLLDLFVPIFVATWIFIKIIKRQPVFLPKIVIPAGLFLLVGFASLLIHSGNLSTSEFFECAFYGVRWGSLFMLAIIVANEDQKNKIMIFYALAVFALLLAIAGFIQLKIMPDFTSYEELGWDPHQGRLLSTWFDPNFVGGFFSFIIPVFIGAFFGTKRLASKAFFACVIAILFIALALTFSRSSYLALIVGLTIFALLKSKKLLIVFAMILVVSVLAVPQIKSRVISLKDSIKAVVTDSYTLPDDSARLRYATWEEGLTLFYKSPFIGQGYNRYKYATLENKTSIDPTSHASTGSDSSLITILATTGLLGFLCFIAVYLLLIFNCFMPTKCGNNTKIGLIAGILAVFVHATFVNSLLFPLLLTPFWALMGILLLSGNATKHSDPFLIT